MLGTEWVALGEGATLLELSKALWMLHDSCRKKKAQEHLYKISLQKRTTGYKTNLRISGQGVSNYDLRRIAVCE